MNKRLARSLSGLALVAASCFPAFAGGADKNLAYNDAYIWQLANRLATSYAMRHGFSTLDPADQSQFLFEISLEYHHRMVACNGPLPLIAPTLQYVLEPQVPELPQHEKILHIIGDTDYAVWPVILNWAMGLEEEITKKFRDRTITTAFPTCLVPGYEMPSVTK